MTISQAHHRFVNLVKNNEALTNPQEFLGPNTDQLIKFWSSLDELTEEQLKTVKGRYHDFCDNQWPEWSKALHESIKASIEIIGVEFSFFADLAAELDYCFVACWATLEIIGGVKNPVFLKMFDNL